MSLIKVFAGLALATAMIAGCGKSRSVETPQGNANIKRLGILYGQFVGSRRGRPPKDEAEFRDFVSKQISHVGDGDAFPDDPFVSPRDGKPYVIPYGAEGQRLLPKGLAAYEQEGSGGKRQAAFTLGQVQELNEEQVTQLLE